MKTVIKPEVIKILSAYPVIQPVQPAVVAAPQPTFWSRTKSFFRRVGGVFAKGWKMVITTVGAVAAGIHAFVRLANYLNARPKEQRA